MSRKSFQVFKFSRDLKEDKILMHDGLTKEEAQAICRDPEASTPEWFLGYHDTEGELRARIKALVARGLRGGLTAGHHLGSDEVHHLCELVNEYLEDE